MLKIKLFVFVTFAALVVLIALAIRRAGRGGRHRRANTERNHPPSS